MKVLLICPSDPSLFPELEFAEQPPVVLCPWISNTIGLIRSSGDIELNVISEFRLLKRDTVIERDDIKYHFLSQKIPYFHRGWPYRVKMITGFRSLRKKVDHIIRTYNPDTIHLFGTEHDLAYCMKFIKRPSKLITIQGLIHEVVKTNKLNYYLTHKLEVEADIFKTQQYFSVQDTRMEPLIHSYNPNAVIFQWTLPSESIEEFSKCRSVDKRSHISFFARITKDKGIEDLLHAIAVVKTIKSDVLLKIMGSCSYSYKNILLKMIRDLDLSENVEFVGYLESRQKLFEEVAASLMTVLPTYYDNVPKTIIESIALGTPVITYEPGMIPGINNEGDVLIIVETSNIYALAKSITGILMDPVKQKLLARRGLEWFEKVHDNERLKNELIGMYKNISNR
jgi:glycosyltransferase involved in cell wall biosynthesis